MTRLSRPTWWTCVAMLLAVLFAGTLNLASGPTLLRFYALVAVLLVAPGWALVAFYAPLRRSLAWSTAIALSLAASILTGLGMLLSHHWHPRVAVTIMLTVTGLLLAAHVVRGLRATAAPGATSAAGPRAARGWRTYVAPGLLALGAVCWLAGIRPLDPASLGSLGLAGSLSPLIWLSLALIVAAFIVELAGGGRRWLLGLCCAALVMAIFGIQSASYSAARLPVAWLHMAFANQILNHGVIIPSYDARFSWPGFFAMAALWAGGAGWTTTEPLLQWAPVVILGLSAQAVYSLARSVLGSGRGPWIATAIFIVADWTEQEYFSPQGTAGIICFATLALIVEYLSGPFDRSLPRVRPWRRPLPATRPVERIFAQVVALVLIAALAPTHQVTPFMLGGLLGALYLTGRLESGWLPLIAVLLPVEWFALGAQDFWMGQFSMLTSGSGDLNSLLNQSIGNRVSGGSGHRLIVLIRMGLTFVIGLLFCAGLVVRRMMRRPISALLLLPIAAFALAILQPYGGEILMRSYLFALPWFGMAASELALAGWSRPRWARATTVATGLVVAALAFTTMVCRGGNDAFVALDRRDIDAINAVDARAADGSTVTAAWLYALPFKMNKLEGVTEIDIQDRQTVDKPCATEDEIYHCLLDAPSTYVVLNPQQEHGGESAGLPTGWLDHLRDRLIREAGYSIVWSENGRYILKSPEAN